MNTFEKLEQLSALAKKSEKLRQRLLETQASKDPLDSFCRQAREAGVDLSIGELFAVGQEYSDNVKALTEEIPLLTIPLTTHMRPF